MGISQAVSTWDSSTFNLLSKTYYNPLLFKFFKLITDLVDILIVCLMIYLLFTKKQNTSKTLTLVLIPVFITAAIIVVLRLILHQGAPLNFILLWTGLRGSFPSGHAGRAFALATVMGFKLPKWLPFFFLLAILIGISRLYIGAHYPTDVIFGALLGVFISWIHIRNKLHLSFGS